MIKHNIYIIALFISIILNSCNKDIEILSEELPETGTIKAGLVIEKANYYVSPSGNDANPGTIDKPFKSWDKVIDVVKPGDLVYLRGGTYYHSTRRKGCAAYLTGKNGLAGQYIRFWAYPGETPILDCRNMPIISGQGIYFSANYWHFKGIEVRNFYQGIDPATGGSTTIRGILVRNASNNIFENVKVYNIQGIGFGMSGTSTNNLVKNSDFYNNYDKYTIISGVSKPGYDADGMHLMASKGCTNTLKGCRFYNNSDDGIDLWENEGTITIDSCWSFKNGYNQGDGNGFKLGRTLQLKETYPQRLIYHCIAYGNSGIGFDQNNANVTMVFYNNASYANKGMGYYLAKYNLKHTIRNNISWLNGAKDLFTAESIISNNSWNGYTITTSSFLSTNYLELQNPRKANGNLPAINFLALSSSSILIDKARNVGFPYLGTAPDIGVFEAR